MVKNDAFYVLLSKKMNFLSHYYFDQTSDAYTVLGTLLPDLTANAQKEWKLYPQKNPQLFENDAEPNAILKGWMRHLAVDKYFHNSIFFTNDENNTFILNRCDYNSPRFIPIVKFNLG